MRLREGLFIFCLVFLMVGMAAAADYKVFPIEGKDPSGSWQIHGSKGGGNVVGPATSDRCFRYSSGRKIIRDQNDKLHVVYVNPYPSDPGDIPPSGGPYPSCTYATSTNEGLTWEQKFLDKDFFSRYPSIAIYGNTLHVIYTNWESQVSNSNIEYTHSTDLGETWSNPVNITSDEYLTGDCDYAGLDVDLDGNPHVSFIWPDNQAVYWTMSADGGTTWSMPEQVSYGQPNGTISFTNVVVNPHTNQPHVVFTADGAAGFYGDKNYYHAFYMDGIWSYPTENVTRHSENDAHCWGCGSLVFDSDAGQYTGYLFVDDQTGGSMGTFHGIGVYKRTDFSTNLGEDGSIWGEPLVVADDAEPQFESRPWYPNAVINPGSNSTSASDDTIFCVFSTGPGGQDGVGEIFIKYSTDKGMTWQDDWGRNPLTTDGDVNYDNWPEVHWGHWSPGHLDIVWCPAAASAFEVQYFDAYIPLYSYDAATVAVDVPHVVRNGDAVAISASVGNKGTRGLLPVKVYCTVTDDSTGGVVFRDSTFSDVIDVDEEWEVSFSGQWQVTGDSYEVGVYTVACSSAYYDPGPPAVVDSFPQNDVFTRAVRVYPGEDDAFYFEHFQEYSSADTSLEALGWTVEDSLNPPWGWLLLIDGEDLSAYCASADEFGLTPQQMDEVVKTPVIDCSGLDESEYLVMEYIESQRAGFWSANPMWLTTLVSTNGADWDTVESYYAPFDGTAGNFIDTKRIWKAIDLTPLVEGGDLSSVQVLFRFTMLWEGQGQGGEPDGHWLVDNFALTHRTKPPEGVEGEPSSIELPSAYVLSQNYPNPFNPVTEISYALPRGEDVRLVVYNLLGQEVRTLVAGHQGAGRHLVRWDGRGDGGNGVSSGVYFYRLEAGDYTQTRRMLLLK